MTPRNLFNIILKLFGLFFLKEIVLVLPQLVYLSLSFTDVGSKLEGLYMLIEYLAILIVCTIFVILLIFKSNFVIDKLRLDKGFDQEEFSFNISAPEILTLGLIVISGIILITEIPNFCRQVYSYFQEKRLTNGMTHPQISYSIISGVKIVLGFLLIGERKRIVAFMLPKPNADSNP